MSSVGMKYLSVQKNDIPTGTKHGDITFINTDIIRDFHDREIAIYGLLWLENILRQQQNWQTIKSYAETNF